jgi:hypothetical protein
MNYTVVSENGTKGGPVIRSQGNDITFLGDEPRKPEIDPNDWEKLEGSTLLERAAFRFIDPRILDLDAMDIVLAVNGKAQCELETERQIPEFDGSGNEVPGKFKSLPDKYFVRRRNRHGRIDKTFGESEKSESAAWVDAAKKALKLYSVERLCDQFDGVKRDERLGWVIYEDSSGMCYSGKEFKKYDADNFPSECINCNHHEPYEKDYFGGRQGWMSFPVLEFLKGKKFDAAAYAVIGILKPEHIRVVGSKGSVTLDACRSRVTVSINNDEDRIIQSVQYETDIPLPKGILNGGALKTLLVDGKAPEDFSTWVINDYAIGKINLAPKDAKVLPPEEYVGAIPVRQEITIL